MPLAPVAYEAAARGPRASYESRVREVLSTLGSTSPDEDVAATGPLLENSKRAKMDPAAAAGIIYATSRHRHPPTSVLGEEENDLRWTVAKNYREIDIYTAKIADGLWAAKAYDDRYPSSGIWPSLVNASTKERAVLGVESDIDKTISKFEYGYRKLTHRNPTDAAEVRDLGSPYTIEQENELLGKRQHWKKSSYDNIEDARKSAVEHAARSQKFAVYNILDRSGNVVESHRGTGGTENTAEDSSPAPCTKPARTVSDECQRLAKQIGPIRSDKELYALVAPQMRKEPQEVFVVVMVDVHGNLVGYTEVARGQVARVAVDIEDVMGAVLSVRPRPSAFAICHNHPSSKVRSSDADKALTEAIRKAAAVAMPNTVLLDHLVIGGGNSRDYYSFTENRVKRG